jgi:hypothetical protein
MKKILFSLLFSSILSFAYAQVDFGLRGGIGLSNIDVRDFETVDGVTDLQAGDAKLNYHAGVYLKVKLLGLFVQPELLFSHIQQDLRPKYSASANGPSELSITFNRIDVPALIGTQIGPFRLMAGPIFSIHTNEVTKNLEDDLKLGSFGYQAGLGLEIGKICVDLRYEDHLSPFASQLLVNNTAYLADLRASMFKLAIGYKLF